MKTWLNFWEQIRHVLSHWHHKNILTRLGYEEDYVNYICYLIRNHDKKITSEQIEKDYELCEKLYEMQRCDALAHHPDSLESRKKYLEETKKLLLKKDNI